MKIKIRFTAAEIKEWVLARARDSVYLGNDAEIEEFSFIVGLPDGDFIGADVEIDDPK